jgi:hypothetical protein
MPHGKLGVFFCSGGVLRFSLLQLELFFFINSSSAAFSSRLQSLLLALRCFWWLVWCVFGGCAACLVEEVRGVCVNRNKIRSLALYLQEEYS